MEHYIPTDTRKAAIRAFIRTSAQALATAIPTGAIVIQLDLEWWAQLMLGALGVAAGSILAGTAAFLMVVVNGLPEEYAS